MDDWLGSEARTLIASAMGGAMRWIASDRRRMRDACVAVAGGAIAGHYLWPLILWALGMETTESTMAMAAFAAGTMGVSGVRILSSLFEARARRLTDA